MWSFEVVMENGFKLEKNETALFQKEIIISIQGGDGRFNENSVMKNKEVVLSQREYQYLE